MKHNIWIYTFFEKLHYSNLVGIQISLKMGHEKHTLAVIYTNKKLIMNEIGIYRERKS